MENKKKYLEIDPFTTAVAEKAIDALQGLTDENNFAQMGFKSLSEVSKAELGVPMRVHYMWIKDLKDLSLQLDDLIHDGNELFYPVEVDGAVRSSITIKRKNLHWEIASLGQAPSAKAIAEIRKANSRSAKNELSDHFIIKLPEIYQVYLAYFEFNGDLHIISVFDHAETKALSGQSQTADYVVASLREYSKIHKSALTPKQ